MGRTAQRRLPAYRNFPAFADRPVDRPTRPDPTRHLDLGCGANPRNPYGASELHGVDIAPPAASTSLQVRQANVAVDPIPYPDGYFDSVSAYDVLEHIPRVLATADGRSTRLPFVELMNEIWRVLAPGGRLYALTPAYPHGAAFQDPTHVNIITGVTHHYFTQPQLLARMYGFHGNFEVDRVLRIRPSSADYEPREHSLIQRLRQWQRLRRGGCSHLLWELIAREAGVPSPAAALPT